jgi:hypothetical protein
LEHHLFEAILQKIETAALMGPLRPAIQLFLKLQAQQLDTDIQNFVRLPHGIFGCCHLCQQDSQDQSGWFPVVEVLSQ